MTTDKGVFDRSGLASLDDFETSGWRELFGAMEAEQKAFLAHEDAFRSAEYRWPRDPLHEWSRVWEYPYTYHHVVADLAKHSGRAPYRVMDLGSGVTFFPFALAKKGAHVVCVDIDPIAGRDLAKANGALKPVPGEVTFLQTDGAKFDLPDASLDAAYCVSVLEHVPDPASLVPEIARVLKPGGRFVLTIDVALEGRNAEIQPDKYAALRTALNRHFRYVHPEDTIHPRRVLTTECGPYPRKSANAAKDVARRVVNGLLKNAVGFERGAILACHAFVFEKA